MIFPCARSRLRIWSHETGSAARSASSCSFSTLRPNLVLTHGEIGDAFRESFYLFTPPTTIGPVPSFIRSRICVPMAFTVESPPVQSHSSPQGSSSNGAFPGVNMSQLMCLSFPTPTISMLWICVVQKVSRTGGYIYMYCCCCDNKHRITSSSHRGSMSHEIKK